MGGYEPSRRFDAWLQETLVHTACDERTERLLEWQQAPAAQAAHPREDHLIPLMVVGGRRERSRRHHLSPEGFCRRAHRIELPFRPRPLISPITWRGAMTSEAFKPIVYLKENCPFFLKVASSFRNRAWHRTWKAATSLLEPNKRRRCGRSFRCVSTR